MKEHTLQIQVAYMLQVVLDPERTFWTALDHAAKLSPRYGAERKRRGVKRGLPDFIVMFQPLAIPSGEMMGLELKSDRGRLSPDQEDVAEKWAHFGFAVYVARSLEDVDEALRLCGVPMLRRMNFYTKGANDERSVRPASPGHRRQKRVGKSKDALPVVQRNAPQKA